MIQHRALQRLVAQTPTLLVDAYPDPQAVRIVNMVASVHLLKPGETLSIPNLLVRARGAAKYTPKSFQAIILRTGDAGPANNVTALVYPNGKMNIVGAINFEHARAYAQQYRLFIEDVLQLEGATCFTNFKVYNTVCSTKLGFRPNLSRLQRLYPLASEWEPELFPGLRLQVWLRPKSECKCVKKAHKFGESCKCNATCLLFDTGKLIATGLHDCNDAPLVCNCVRLFFCDQSQFQDHTAELPRHLRWNHRMAQKLEGLQIDFIGTCKRPATMTETANQVLDQTRHRVKRTKHDAQALAPVSTLAPIFQACDAGDLDMVAFCMSLDAGCLAALDDQGCTPLERVSARRADYGDPSTWSSLLSLLGAGDEEDEF